MTEPTTPKNTESESENQPIIDEALKDLCANNADYFANDISENGQRLYLSFLCIKEKIDEIQPVVSELEAVVSQYDFDDETPGNGYRSFLSIVASAKQHAVMLNKKVCLKRDSVLFRKTTVTKEVESCSQIFASLQTCLNLLTTIMKYSPSGGLFATEHNSPHEILSHTEDINQYCFYGRSLGFQFSESMRGVLQFITLSMAIFSEAYYSEGSLFSKATNSVLTSTRFIADPELRARRIVHISRNADVLFCKAFWFLSESELMQYLPAVVAQRVAISRIINIPTEVLTMRGVSGEREVEVPVPTAHIGRKPVQVRLISYEAREGMIGEGVAKSSKIQPPSRGLLIHCHGGGFVAQSSRSHETYLRQWSRDLGVPILSIDYSLAPQAPYPRALEEVMYAYCWAVKNCRLLGSTGERIVAAGDSAGANLLTAATLKCIDMEIPPPMGLFLAYAPTFVNFIPSPARLLCMMDPLLPFGILMRCLKAYVCTKSDKNGGSSVNLTLPSDTESFEEISESDLFELQAHKSPVSEMSDTTLTYGSLSSHTDEQQLNGNAGGVIVRGLDDVNIDLDDSENTAASSAHKFDFLEKYVLDSDTDTDGTRIPIITATTTPSQQLPHPPYSNPTVTPTTTTRSTVTLEDYLPAKVTSFMARLRSQMSSTTTTAATGNDGAVAMETKGTSSSSGASSASLILDADGGSTALMDSLQGLNVPLDPYLSPYCARDEVLRKMPPVKIVTVHLDPCLDDCVMFARKLKNLDSNVTLDILTGLPHGFLNFSLVSKEAYEGSKLCVKRISELLDLDNLPPLT